VREIESALEVNVFGVARKDFLKAGKIAERYPFMARRTIAKGTYKSNKDFDIETLTLAAFITRTKTCPRISSMRSSRMFIRAGMTSPLRFLLRG